MGDIFFQTIQQFIFPAMASAADYPHSSILNQVFDRACPLFRFFTGDPDDMMKHAGGCRRRHIAVDPLEGIIRQLNGNLSLW